MTLRCGELGWGCVWGRIYGEMGGMTMQRWGGKGRIPRRLGMMSARCAPMSCCVPSQALSARTPRSRPYLLRPRAVVPVDERVPRSPINKNFCRARCCGGCCATEVATQFVSSQMRRRNAMPNTSHPNSFHAAATLEFGSKKVNYFNLSALRKVGDGTWRACRSRCGFCWRTCCAARTARPLPRTTFVFWRAGTRRPSRRARLRTCRRAC